MTDDLLVQLFYAAQGNITQFRIKARALLADGGKGEAAAYTLLAALVDIYDDGMNNAPEDRCYVEGAWKETLDEARAYLAAPQAECVPREAMASHLFEVLMRRNIEVSSEAYLSLRVVGVPPSKREFVRSVTLAIEQAAKENA